MGWDIFEGSNAPEFVERIVELIVTNPLVNILRGAMSILVGLVSHSQSGAAGTSPKKTELYRNGGAPAKAPGTFGFRALRPSVAVYPDFFGLVIAQLQSADHALCANALALINALIRDVLSTDASCAAPAASGGSRSNYAIDDWPKFIEKLQDLGLIKAVYNLMQSSALHDLAHPLLEFQGLTKLLLRKWREVRVNLERPDHRRALKGLHLASAPERSYSNGTNGLQRDEFVAESSRKGSKRHNPEKWRRLGFETESPALEFEHMGFLGMMDMTDYVRKNEDGFQKLLLEQAAQPMHMRCPIAKSSLAVTMILYDHFEVEKPEEDVKTYQLLEGTKNSDKVFRPLLLQWSRLHTAGLQAFLRLWKATGAEQDDFDKVGELVRILIEQVVGQAGRTKDVVEVEEELQEFDCAKLRELQMGLLELAFEDQWGVHLYEVREQLKREALQFVKEQRLRCLLEGSWFFKPVSKRDGEDGEGKPGSYQPSLSWRFAKLSHNRRFLHYADFAQQMPQDPGLDALTEKVDLSIISSVVSNVSAPKQDDDQGDDDNQTVSSNGTPRPYPAPKSSSTTKITIYSYENGEEAAKAASGAPDAKEQAILVMHPQSHSLASEWLDGLLMLLNQAPITAETSRLVGLVSDYGLKIRSLNVRLDSVYTGLPSGTGVVPNREGLDEDYYYLV